MSPLRSWTSRPPAEPVLLSIRGTDAPEPDAGAFSFLGTIGDHLAAVWRGGVRALAGSIGLLVQVLIGGAVWWALLAVAVVVWTRWSRARVRAGI